MNGLHAVILCLVLLPLSTVAGGTKFVGRYYHGCRFDNTNVTADLGGPNDPAATDPSNIYFDAVDKIYSLQECASLCASRSDCVGIEYQGNYDICELWKVEIGYFKLVFANIACFVRETPYQPPEETAAPSPAPTTITIEEVMQPPPEEAMPPPPEEVMPPHPEPADAPKIYYQGFVDHACRFDSNRKFLDLGGPYDPFTFFVSNVYYDLLTGITSPEECQEKCSARPDCVGVEYSSSRCELWKANIGWTKPMPGFVCYKKAFHKEPIISDGEGVGDVIVSHCSTSLEGVNRTMNDTEAAMFDLIWANKFNDNWMFLPNQFQVNNVIVESQIMTFDGLDERKLQPGERTLRRVLRRNTAASFNSGTCNDCNLESLPADDGMSKSRLLRNGERNLASETALAWQAFIEDVGTALALTGYEAFDGLTAVSVSCDGGTEYNATLNY